MNNSSEQLTFNNRVVIVTGAGRGMGRSHALLLAARGASVVVNDLGTTMDGSGVASEDPARDVVAEIRAAGGVAIASSSDVSTEGGVSNLIESCMDAFGRVDALVHNAGTATFVPFSQLSYEHFRQIVAVHADGAFLLARAVWPHMVKQRYGRILMITSQAALNGVSGLAHYAVGKWGATGLSRILALEGAEANICANALGVSALSRMMERRFVDASGKLCDEESYLWWRRYVRPEIISPVVAWLVHENCTVSGEIFDTTAGHTSRQVLAMTEGFTDIDLTPERVRDNFERVMDTGGGYHIFRPGAGHGPMQWMHGKVAALLTKKGK